jgi:hypothetical protein
MGRPVLSASVLLWVHVGRDSLSEDMKPAHIAISLTFDRHFCRSHVDRGVC